MLSSGFIAIVNYSSIMDQASSVAVIGILAETGDFLQTESGTEMVTENSP